MRRPRITGRWRRPPDWIAPVWERPCDGLRVHAGGSIRWADGARWSARRWTDSRDPLWRLACRVEPKGRRALMLYADLRQPAAPEVPCDCDR